MDLIKYIHAKTSMIQLLFLPGILELHEGKWRPSTVLKVYENYFAIFIE